MTTKQRAELLITASILLPDETYKPRFFSWETVRKSRRNKFLIK